MDLKNKWKRRQRGKGRMQNKSVIYVRENVKLLKLEMGESKR